MDGQNNTQDPQNQNPPVPQPSTGMDTTQNSMPTPVSNVVPQLQQEESEDASQQPVTPPLTATEDGQSMPNPVPPMVPDPVEQPAPQEPMQPSSDVSSQPSMPQPVQDTSLQPPMPQPAPEAPMAQEATQPVSPEPTTSAPEPSVTPEPAPTPAAEPMQQDTAVVTPPSNDTLSQQPQSEASPMTPPAPTPEPPVTPEPTAPEATMSPAPENPPAPDQTAAAPQPATESLQATVPLPDPDPAQQNATAPSMPSHKGGFNWWLIMSLVLLVLVACGGVYMYMLSSKQPAQEAVRMATPTKAVSPTTAVSLTPAPSGTASAGLGRVAGTMCYPASGIPAGIITAKDTTTGKEYTQTYTGTGNGASTSYTLDLPVGSYHLKFTPTQYPTVVGYYTDYSSCVGNPSGANCSGQKVRPLLAATVSANLTVQNVNLCDYYYPTNNPPQF